MRIASKTARALDMPPRPQASAVIVLEARVSEPDILRWSTDASAVHFHGMPALNAVSRHLLEDDLGLVAYLHGGGCPGYFSSQSSVAFVMNQHL